MSEIPIIYFGVKLGVAATITIYTVKTITCFGTKKILFFWVMRFLKQVRKCNEDFDFPGLAQRGTQIGGFAPITG